MSSEIQVGVVVKLKSVSQKMTVVKRHGENITCCWIDKIGELQEHIFPRQALNVVDDNSKGEKP